MLHKLTAVAVAASALLAGAASADSISPTSVSGTLAVGGSTTINKTVTISAGAPTSAKLDVMFLVDTTGSMGGTVSTVQSNVSAIVSNLTGYGDAQFGVAEYKDGNVGAYADDPFISRIDQNLTSNSSDFSTGLGMLSADGGGDYPESDLYGLNQVATDTSWRSDAAHIVVWFGDAPSHDPDSGVTQASAIAALNSAGAKVFGINVGGGGLDDLGQATAVTSGTGGALFSSGYSTGLLTAIEDAISTSFSTYSSVSLGVSGDTSCVSVDPSAAQTGSFDRSADRTFNFTVKVSGSSPGSCDFNVNALVDGGFVAKESDSFKVTGVSTVPLPAAGCLLLAGIAGLGAMKRRRSA